VFSALHSFAEIYGRAFRDVPLTLLTFSPICLCFLALRSFHTKESLWSYRHPRSLNVVRPLRLLVSMSFFSSCFRFVAILPSAAFDTLVKSEVGGYL
jgi:hypothetical protein